MSIFLLVFLIIPADFQADSALSLLSTDTHIERFGRHSANNGLQLYILLLLVKFVSVSCILPPYPKYGRWVVVNGDGREGEKIPPNSILEFYCRKGYKLSSKSSYVICQKSGIFLNIPICLKLCPALYSTPTTILKCADATGHEMGCHEAVENTYLTYTCAPFYEAPIGYTTSFCSDGEWNTVSKPSCQPVCGKKVHDDAKTLVYRGYMEKAIEYPWVAVIFKKEYGQYINCCGGSVISQRLVLTAAHCVTNNYGDALSNDIFLVGVGKLYNSFNDSKDTNAQYLKVSKVLVHPSYRGNSRRFLADIAILVVKDAFKLNQYVGPVCFGDLKNINLQVGSIGLVSGFGVTEDGDPSEVLRTLEIPYKSEDICAAELPVDWGDRYNVIDKICAGFYKQNKSICSGDSGNGLFFKNPDNNRYYIHGIASLGHSLRGKCNMQQNSLYTKVAFHYDFVDREIIKYYIKDCVLPPYPENGKWTTKYEDKKPGSIVRSNTVLVISCDYGYLLSSGSSHLTCESTFVMPRCEKLCPRPDVPQNVGVNCKSKEGDVIRCTEATDHSTLTFNCGHGAHPVDMKDTIKCLNGSWDSLMVCKFDVVEPEEEVDSSTKIVCIYNGKQYDGGVKPKDLNAKLCTHVMYNSAEVSFEGNLVLPRNNASILAVADMKKRNTDLKLILSIYGRGKEEYEYPIMAADPVKRTIFVNDVTSFLQRYEFDGVNIHWEVPLYNDREKYITLLRELKAAFNVRPRRLLSTSVYYTYTYLGYAHATLPTLVDWINVECYNLYTEWSSYTGQNAAMYPSSLERDYERDNYNLKACSTTWEPYFNRRNIVSAGVAFFGRYYTLKNENNHGLHAPVTGSTNASDTGLVSYAKICQKYRNWTRKWDKEQMNPYKYYKNKWVGYDDPNSIQIKAEFIDSQRYFGVTVNSIDQDDVYGNCGPKQALLKYIHIGLGNEVNLEENEVEKGNAVDTKLVSSYSLRSEVRESKGRAANTHHAVCYFTWILVIFLTYRIR